MNSALDSRSAGKPQRGTGGRTHSVLLSSFDVVPDAGRGRASFNTSNVPVATSEARAKTPNPQCWLPVANSWPPIHGPKTAPNRPMPVVHPMAVARLDVGYTWATAAYTIVCALKRNTPAAN